MTAGSRTWSRRLAAHPASVGEGRRFIREALVGSRDEHLSEAAELLVSEVVTNALVHAGTEVELVARLERPGVRVEVSDGSPHVPATKHYSSLTATGRGMHLLEQLVDRWGVEPHDHGKTVWFELGTRQRAARGPDLTPDPAGSGTDRSPVSFAVELLNVPLLLHAAWQMQAESLLREHLLSQLGEDNGTDQIERHAAASEALALLSEQVPAPTLEDAPDVLMATAVEPRVSAELVLLTVPSASVPHFRMLHEILTAATRMADAGALLTPPSQPELQALRRWLCTEVQQQTDGGRPGPWVGDVDDAAPPRLAAEWDSSMIAGATAAMLAADDTSRILAVSPAALALLGYDDASELVPRRLVAIIPPRYRQAHLAGFTLHLFAGRSPLLAAPVTVPALRRDGSEVMVDLTVSAHHLARGRKVFIASLTASDAVVPDSA